MTPNFSLFDSGGGGGGGGLMISAVVVFQFGHVSKMFRVNLWLDLYWPKKFAK